MEHNGSTSSGCLTSSLGPSHLSKDIQNVSIHSEHWFCTYFGSLIFEIEQIFNASSRNQLIDQSMEHLLCSSEGVDVHLEISMSSFSFSENSTLKSYKLGDVYHLSMKEYYEEQYLVVIFIDDKMQMTNSCRFSCFKCFSPDGEEIIKWVQYLFSKSHAIFMEINNDKSPTYRSFKDKSNRLMVATDQISIKPHISQDYKTEKIVIKLKNKEMKKIGISLDLAGHGSLIPSVYITFIEPYSAASTCLIGGKLKIGDLIVSCNGLSLVGLSLEECTNIIEANIKLNRITLEIIKNNPISVVEFFRKEKIEQLGFSLSSCGMISTIIRCSLAELNGLKLGQQIIEFNGICTIGMNSIDLMSFISSTNGQILLKTMPSKIFQIMTGSIDPNII